MSYPTRVVATHWPERPGISLLSATREKSAERLARFFPAASPLRLPVRVSRMAGDSEAVLIEYGTSQVILFATALPLDCGERVRVRNADGSLDTDAVVVALQFDGSQTVVAARFLSDLPNWIVKG